MSEQLKRPRIIVALFITILALGAVLWMTLPRGLPHAQASTIMTAPTAAQVSAALGRIGIDARTLAALGGEAETVGAIVGDAQTWLTTNAQALAAADAAYSSALTQHDTLVRLVQSGLAASSDLSALSAAREDLATDTAARTALLASLRTAVEENLSSGQRQTLATTIANTTRELAFEYLTAARTDPQWVALRSALADERYAASSGETISTASAELLTSVRQESPVSSAISNINTRLPTISSAWNTAMNNVGGGGGE